MSCDTDDYSPIYVGDVGAPFNPVFEYADGTLVDLTGATITMKFLNENTAAIITTTGTWTIDTDPTTGKASYAYASNDVSVAGLYTIYITITKSGKPFHADTKQLEIKAAI
jgi:hypothetical protein